MMFHDVFSTATLFSYCESQCFLTTKNCIFLVALHFPTLVCYWRSWAQTKVAVICSHAGHQQKHTRILSMKPHTVLKWHVFVIAKTNTDCNVVSGGVSRRIFLFFAFVCGPGFRRSHICFLYFMLAGFCVCSHAGHRKHTKSKKYHNPVFSICFFVCDLQWNNTICVCWFPPTPAIKKQGCVFFWCCFFFYCFL